MLERVLFIIIMWVLTAGEDPGCWGQASRVRAEPGGSGRGEACTAGHTRCPAAVQAGCPHSAASGPNLLSRYDHIEPAFTTCVTTLMYIPMNTSLTRMTPRVQLPYHSMIFVAEGGRGGGRAVEVGSRALRPGKESEPRAALMKHSGHSLIHICELLLRLLLQERLLCSSWSNPPWQVGPLVYTAGNVMFITAPNYRRCKDRYTCIVQSVTVASIAAVSQEPLGSTSRICQGIANAVCKA